ncbi:hypothetical protein [Sutterella sp.]|uniref:hypothetical protein n=1 Tax=Sutterella sp. TaxID=1981025 RepID=UPI0025E7B4D7|nr:hypothetical protein [uncultured Sutterella sp.]
MNNLFKDFWKIWTSRDRRISLLMDAGIWIYGIASDKILFTILGGGALICGVFAWYLEAFSDDEGDDNDAGGHGPDRGDG